MANQKIIEKKQQVVEEIINNIQNSKSVIFFEYNGLSVLDMTELRKKLRSNNADLKVYKNTLTKRAVDSLKINLSDHLIGQKAMAFGDDAVIPVKTLSEFAKTNPALQIKVGMIEGNIADINTLTELAQLPSREGLLTMLAGGLMGTVRDLAICLDLHIKNLENN